MAASLELVSRFQLTHERPDYGISRIKAGNQEVAVFEEAALKTPFGTLLHFRKDMEARGPKVLVVAPLSGHFATLLRSTVETLLADHDVYITDWANARDVPVSAGVFGFDDYLDHVMDFLRAIGPPAHVVAVCQPCVQTLAAAAIMAERGRYPELARALYERVFDARGGRFTLTVLRFYAARGHIDPARITPIVADLGEALVFKLALDADAPPSEEQLVAIVDQAILPALGLDPAGRSVTS